MDRHFFLGRKTQALSVVNFSLLSAQWFSLHGQRQQKYSKDGSGGAAQLSAKHNSVFSRW